MVNCTVAQVSDKWSHYGFIGSRLCQIGITLYVVVQWIDVTLLLQSTVESLVWSEVDCRSGHIWDRLASSDQKRCRSWSNCIGGALNQLTEHPIESFTEECSWERWPVLMSGTSCPGLTHLWWSPYQGWGVRLRGASYTGDTFMTFSFSNVLFPVRFLSYHTLLLC